MLDTNLLVGVRPLNTVLHVYIQTGKTYEIILYNKILITVNKTIMSSLTTSYNIIKHNKTIINK